MNNITYKIITDLQDAKEVWEKLSPKTRLSDDWNFRYTYYKYFKYSLFFYTAFDNNEPVATLPLQWNEKKKHLDFFGGGYFSDNKPFALEEYHPIIDTLIKQIDQPARLEWMDYSAKNFPESKIEDQMYYLPLSGLKDYEDFIERTLTGSSKKQLKKHLRRLLEKNIKVTKGTIEDFEFLVEFNKKRFGLESRFFAPHRLDFFRDVINNFDAQIITISVDDNVEAVGISIFYNNVYYGLNAGASNEIDNLGKFLYLQKIDQAIKLGATEYNAGSGSFGWKEAFHLEKRPQYELDLR